MTVTDFTDLSAHLNHQVQVVQYGADEPTNAAIECVDCGEVLLDFDATTDHNEPETLIEATVTIFKRDEKTWLQITGSLFGPFIDEDEAIDVISTIFRGLS